MSLTSLVRADTGQDDLVSAKDAFESVKVAMSSQINTLHQQQRVAIWTQYYLALEHLQRMDIHQQMMVQHKMDRGEQFREAHTEFTQALGELIELLPESANLLQ